MHEPVAERHEGEERPDGAYEGARERGDLGVGLPPEVVVRPLAHLEPDRSPPERGYEADRLEEDAAAGDVERSLRVLVEGARRDLVLVPLGRDGRLLERRGRGRLDRKST